MPLEAPVTRARGRDTGPPGIENLVPAPCPPPPDVTRFIDVDLRTRGSGSTLLPQTNGRGRADEQARPHRRTLGDPNSLRPGGGLAGPRGFLPRRGSGRGRCRPLGADRL